MITAIFKILFFNKFTGIFTTEIILISVYVLHLVLSEHYTTVKSVFKGYSSERTCSAQGTLLRTRPIFPENRLHSTCVLTSNFKKNKIFDTY